jgi:hypothetical protein
MVCPGIGLTSFSGSRGEGHDFRRTDVLGSGVSGIFLFHDRPLNGCVEYESVVAEQGRREQEPKRARARLVEKGGVSGGMIMASHYHAIVWINHHEARIIHFNADTAEEERIRPADPPQHLHVKAGSPSGMHVTNEPQFYRDVADALADAREILVTGPSTAKAEFLKYVHKHAPQMMERIAGIETLAQVTDYQLLAEARRFFDQADRMRPQRG